jgi:hypothetical protein
MVRSCWEYQEQTENPGTVAHEQGTKFLTLSRKEKFHLRNRAHDMCSAVTPYIRILSTCHIPHQNTSLKVIHYKQQTPWPYSESELYRLSDHRLSAKLVPTFVDRGCCVVSATDTQGRILGFLDRSSYHFFQVAPQLYSRGWVDSVPDPLHFRKSGISGNRGRTSGSVARNSDH